MFSSDCRKNEKIDTLSSDNKRLRCERDSAEDTLHQEQRALRDSQQRADEKLSNMELLLATRDTALKMQERATEQLEEENIKLYEKCRILRNISRELEGTMKSREKRAVMRLIDDLAAVAKRKYEDIGETATDESEDRPTGSLGDPLPRLTPASSAETLPMLPRSELPTPEGEPRVMQPTSPAPALPQLPVPEPASTNAARDGGASSASYSSDSDTEKANDDKSQGPTATAEATEAQAALLEAPAAEAIEPGDIVV